jgi:hypothetical protein
MHVDRRLLGWGLFFILVGAVPLAVRADLLDESIVRAWPSLWPLLLIAWGIGLVLRRTPLEWTSGVVLVTTLGLMGGGAIATGFGGVSMGTCGSGDPGAAFETQRGTVPGQGRLDVELGCGDVVVTTASGSDWSVSGTDSGGRAPRITTSGSTVTIERDGGGSIFDDAGRTSWNVAVPTSPELALALTLHAGSGTANLAGASLSSLALEVNAGSYLLDAASAARLGDVRATVIAGDAQVLLPAGDRSANLSLNAGNIELCLPADAAVRVECSGALGSNDLDDAGLVKVDDDTWTSAGFDENAPHLELDVSATAGSFELSLGGVCRA